MSSGGLAQLVAIGAQDTWITGKPEVSFFQSVYKRHTNFSHLVSRQTLQGDPNPRGMSSVIFDKSGDLMGYVYITAVCTINGTPSSFQTINWSNIIDHVELYVGGQLIDSQDSTFSEFLAPSVLAQNSTKSSSVYNHGGYGTPSFFYPLRFWFCENFNSILPIVALRYHDIEIRIYWSVNMRSTNRDYYTSDLNVAYSDPAPASSVVNFEVYTHNVYLDVEERKFMANKTHDLLITQVQKTNPPMSLVATLLFSHPVKFICATSGTVSTVTPGNTNALTSYQNKIVIQVNGVDLADYKFACPHFTQIPSYYHVPYSYSNSSSYFMLPFCLDTAKFQPTGTLNFSRLDSFKITSQSTPITSTIYGVNYNIFRIKDGMGGLMYSH